MGVTVDERSDDMKVFHNEDGSKTVNRLIRVKVVCEHGYCDPHTVPPAPGVVRATVEEFRKGFCDGGYTTWISDSQTIRPDAEHEDAQDDQGETVGAVARDLLARAQEEKADWHDNVAVGTDETPAKRYLAPSRMTVEAWRLRVRSAGRSIANKAHSRWNDMPGEIAEGAIAKMLHLLEENGYDLDEVTAADIGGFLGVLDGQGEWL